MRLDLRSALTRLTHKQRCALSLWTLGYTQAEIAKIGGVGQPAISMRIRRAREMLETGQT
jgi:DNA-directed RNA polymerase specialized sigma24 family protein